MFLWELEIFERCDSEQSLDWEVNAESGSSPEIVPPSEELNEVIVITGERYNKKGVSSNMLMEIH